ncbi:uncharacterized protein [Triticum aestivum]|uniref:uncharacterized protein n=1 Tax=Triticum aestivum TaxID=4565 RepID=UPI001D00BAC3|nr:uncharacterized protein LOC123103835 [Triticum aestivum]
MACCFAARGNGTAGPSTCLVCDGLVLKLAKVNYLVLQLVLKVHIWSWPNQQQPSGASWAEPVSFAPFAFSPCRLTELTRGTPHGANARHRGELGRHGAGEAVVVYREERQPGHRRNGLRDGAREAHVGQIVSPARERYPAGERLSSNLAVSFFSHQASPAMAATGLNAYARPYSRRSARAHLTPLKPHPSTMLGYHGHAGYPPPSPFAANYSRATFPEHHYPGALPPRPFFREHVAAPRYDRRPRGVMFDPEKMYAQVMHSFSYKHKGRAAAAGKGKGGPVTRPLLPAAPPCGLRGQRARGRRKVYVPAAHAGGRRRSRSRGGGRGRCPRRPGPGTAAAARPCAPR